MMSTYQKLLQNCKLFKTTVTELHVTSDALGTQVKKESLK